MEATNAKRTGPALEAMYRFMLWPVPTVSDREMMGWLVTELLGAGR
jgi:hypothetical protein